jgi:TrbC/VIRB2 pilin
MNRTYSFAVNTRLQNRAALALVVVAAGLLASSPAAAQALAPVVRGATIARDTVVAITLVLMTVGVGIAGYKIMFAGASFRDVSNLLFGGALAGAAAAIAAVFIN